MAHYATLSRARAARRRGRQRRRRLEGLPPPAGAGPHAEGARRAPAAAPELRAARGAARRVARGRQGRVLRHRRAQRQRQEHAHEVPRRHLHAPTRGEMWLRGRMAPFIELGVGFNPDLTAHDNVLLNAVMLGLTPDQARERYDAIIDFAELREFQDLKLKNYSSGMQVRLAFAVMVHVDADLLLIDEVLAVGDAAFQQKCYDVLHRTCAATGARSCSSRTTWTRSSASATARCCSSAASVVAIGDAARGGAALHRAQLRAAARARRRRTRYEARRRRRSGRATIVDCWLQDGEGVRTETLEQGDLRARCACACASWPRRSTRCSASRSRDAYGRAVFARHDGVGRGAGPHVRARRAARRRADLRQLARPGALRARRGEIRHPGSGRRALAVEDEAASFIVTGSRSGGGAVDIPHAFYYFQRGRAAGDAGRMSDVAYRVTGPAAPSDDPRRFWHLTRDARADGLEGPVLRIGPRLRLVAPAAAAALRDPLPRLQRGRRRGRRRRALPDRAAQRHDALLLLRRGDGRARRPRSSTARRSCARSAFPRMVVPLAVALVGAFNLLLNLVVLAIFLVLNGVTAALDLAAAPDPDRAGRRPRHRDRDAARGALRALPRHQADLGGLPPGAVLRDADPLPDHARAGEVRDASPT